MKAFILIGFFLCVVVVVSLAIAGYVKRDDSARSPADGLLAFVDEDVKQLEKKKIELEQEKVSLEMAKVQDKREAIPFTRRFKNYGPLAALGSILLSLIIVSLGYHKKLSTHILKIGKHSQIPVKHKDLSKLSPEVAVSLSLAEQLRQDGKSHERAFELYEKSAQILTKQLAIILGKYGRAAQMIDITPERPALSAPIPSFRDLILKEAIAPGKELIFGYTETGQAKTGTWVDLFSSAVGGVSGTGKTATLRNLIAQSLISEQVETFWIIDYHYPHPKSLLATLGPLKDLPYIQYAENNFQAVEILEDVNDTIDRRLAGKEPSFPVKVLCIDEVLILCRNCPRAVEIILRIATESRKAGVYGLFSAQTWKADAVGGSEVRDCLTSRFAHKMQPKQANLLLQDSDQSKQVKTLTTGQALFAPVNGQAEVLTIPYCDPSDMKTVYNIVGNTIRKVQPAINRTDPHVRRGTQPMQKIPQNPELAEVDRLFDELATQKTNIVEFPKKAQPDPKPPGQELPSPELVLELLKANCEASPLTKTDWLKSFSQQCGVSESLLKKLLLGQRNLSQEALEKIVPCLMTDVHRTPGKT